MDIDKLKESLTREQIIKILESLGSGYKLDNNGNPYFQTVCHNRNTKGSWKLYYYEDIYSFKCFTECGIMSIYTVIQKAKNISFIQALNYVQNICGIRTEKRGFNSPNVDLVDDDNLTDDWDLINKYTDYNKILQKKEKHEYETIPSGILALFDSIMPTEWLDEGISVQTMKLFNIKMDLYNKKIIIPHYDMDGNLIGIRCRYLDPFDYEYLNRGKYNPLYYQNKMYNHNLSHNLYGLNFTKRAIERTKKIILFESEKSVMKCQDFYGENNFAVALCGHSISKAQRNMILELGVNEVFIALDKDYTDETSEEGEKWAEIVLRECYKFAPYVTTYLLWDSNDLNVLGYKDSPCDKGKETLELLMKNKFEILTKEGEKIGRKRKTNRPN